jgi:hypothetical protein
LSAIKISAHLSLTEIDLELLINAKIIYFLRIHSPSFVLLINFVIRLHPLYAFDGILLDHLVAGPRHGLEKGRLEAKTGLFGGVIHEVGRLAEVEFLLDLLDDLSLLPRHCKLTAGIEMPNLHLELPPEEEEVAAQQVELNSKGSRYIFLHLPSVLLKP